MLTNYDPIKIPAVVVKWRTPGEPKAAILLFANGKVVCTGLKKLEDCNRKLRELERELEWTGCYLSERRE